MKKTGTSKSFMKPYLRGLPIILGGMAICIMFARTYLKYATPMYESTTKIRLADAKEGVPNGNLYKNFDVFASTNKIGAEVELLKSDVLIEKVLKVLSLDTVIYRVGEIHTTELYRESPINIHANTLSPDMLDKHFGLIITGRNNIKLTTPDGKEITAMMNKPIEGKGFSFTITLNNALIAERPNIPVNDKYDFVINSRKSLVAKVVAGMDVTSVDKDIPILRVSYKCADARKSADIVNVIANVYIKDYIEEKSRSADTTEQFLNEQLREYSSRLTNSENRVQNYRDDKNIINIRQETETDLRKVADLKKQLASVQMNLLAIDTLNQYMTRNKNNFVNIAPNFEAFTDLLSTEIVKKVKLLQAEKRDLLLKYTPENPKVIVIDNKIADLAAYLQESIHNTQTNLRLKYNDLQNTIAEAEAAFAGLPEKEKDMTILERDFGMNEQIYRFIREKRTEAQIAKAATIAFHRVISRGEVPDRPVSPNAKLLIVFSGFLGFIFSIIAIFLVHSAKGRVDNEQNIYRSSDTPLEKSIPFMKSEKDTEEFFDEWILEMELNKKLNPGTIMCITSLNNNEGKEFTSNGLVNAASALGKKVLLVTMEGSIIDFAADHYEVTSPGLITHRWRIPTEWDSIAESWKAEYDLIIIRNFALNTSNVSILPLAKSDINLMLLDSRLTKLKEITVADDMKEKLQLTTMSFVLNRAGYAPGILNVMLNAIKKLRNAK